MREIPLEQINEMEDGELIPSFSGQIKAVFDRKSGTNKYGEWSFQDAIIQAGDVESRLKLVNRAEFKAFKGKDVVISATKSKDGLVGVRKLIEQYNDKTYPKIEVTDEAEVSFDKNGSEPDEIPMTHDDKGQALSGVDEAKQSAMQGANGMLIALESARYTVLEWEKRHPAKISEDQFQAITSSFFIRLDRKGFIDNLPKSPLAYQEL